MPAPVAARLPRAWPARARTCRRLLPRERRCAPNAPARRSGRIVDTPTAPAGRAAARTTPIVGRGSETVNYEISKVIRHTVRPRGEVARLSVAVILDDESVVAKNPDGTTSRTTHARKPEEIQKIQSLVAAAVGLDATRGDQLTIENVPFEEIAGRGGAEGRPLAARRAAGLRGRSHPGCRRARRARVLHVRQAAHAPRHRAMPWRSQPSALPEHLSRNLQDLEGEIEAQLDAAWRKVGRAA